MSQIHATTIYSYVTKLKFDLYNTQKNSDSFPEITATDITLLY